MLSNPVRGLAGGLVKGMDGEEERVAGNGYFIMAVVWAMKLSGCRAEALRTFSSLSSSG